MVHIIRAIKSINPDAVVVVTNNDVNQIEWLENTPVIDKQLILNKQIEMQLIEDEEIAEKEARKNSALSKLEALGLTQEEIQELIK